MALASLVVDLKASLHDSASVFRAPDDADFRRFLAEALPDMQFKRPITLMGFVQLEAGVGRYAMPVTDFAAWKTHAWGAGQVPARRPWEPMQPGPMPRVCATSDGSAWWVELDPSPTPLQLAAWGSSLPFWYFRRHELGEAEEDTTVNPLDRGLLLLRAQAQAMLELSVRNAGKPVQMRDGLSGTPRNSTPTALHEMLMKLFREAK